MPVDKESYTRIFIMGGRSGEGCDKDDYRAAFGKFGNVADIFMATDRQTRRENGANQTNLLANCNDRVVRGRN